MHTSTAWSSRMLSRFSGGASPAEAAWRRPLRAVSAPGRCDIFGACVVTADADTESVRVMPDRFPGRATRGRAPRYFPHRQIPPPPVWSGPVEGIGTETKEDVHNGNQVFGFSDPPVGQ